MQKWEYLYLYNREKSYAINGVEYKYKSQETVFTIIDRLGKEGWELVAQPQIGAHTFKRPLEE